MIQSMKFFVIPSILISFTTSAFAQSYDQYDAGFRKAHVVQAALTASSELMLGGAIAATYTRKFEIAFWKKYLPKETAKLTETIASKNAQLAEIKNLKKNLASAAPESKTAIQTQIKEAQGFAKEWDKEIKTVAAELKTARIAKMKSWGIMGKISTFKIFKVETYKYARVATTAICILAVANGVTRTFVLLTDKPSEEINNDDLNNLTPEDMQEVVLP